MREALKRGKEGVWDLILRLLNLWPVLMALLTLLTGGIQVYYHVSDLEKRVTAIEIDRAERIKRLLASRHH